MKASQQPKSNPFLSTHYREQHNKEPRHGKEAWEVRAFILKQCAINGNVQEVRKGVKWHGLFQKFRKVTKGYDRF